MKKVIRETLLRGERRLENLETLIFEIYYNQLEKAP